MTDERARRGQTTLDYTIAILVFIAVVLFVFLFVPGILEPFGGGEGEDPAVADRIGNTLSHDMLSGADQPQVLDRQCTVEFFDEGVSPSECDNFEGTTVAERLDLTDIQNVNVRILGNVTGSGEEVVCWDEGNNEWTDLSQTDCDDSDEILLNGGSTLPQDSTATITSTRVVSLRGQPVTLVVRVW